MKFFKMNKNIKVATVIKYLLLCILIMLFSAVLLSDITCLIFMIIRNMTGCTPFMANTIEKVSDINTTALKMWAEDC